MRALSFVNRIELEFQGNVFKDAIALGDLDNDGNNEMAIGNIGGMVAVYKGSNSKPWKSCTDVGMVTSVVIGDIFNEDRNVLIVISGEGWCNIIDVNQIELEHHLQETACGSPLPETSASELYPCHTQRIMANTKIAILEDIDKDGAVELVIGLTDRVVRTYRWTIVSPVNEVSRSTGKLIAIHKWEFASQIGNITSHINRDGSPCLLVAQPGGAFMKLHCYTVNPDMTVEGAEEAKEALTKMSPECHPLASSKMRNPNVSSEILGNIESNMKYPPYAVATADGCLMLVEGEEIIWTLQVDHQLFSLDKLDITGDGRDEIIASSWDGQTYIINQEQRCVKFHFEETVSTFAAGMYAVAPGENAPCLVYVTYNNRIYLYHDVRLPQMSSSTLISQMERSPKTEEILHEVDIHPNNQNQKNQVQKLYHWMLYSAPTYDEHLWNEETEEIIKTEEKT